jgi:hypothetical protein
MSDDLVLWWTCSGADPHDAARLDLEGSLRERVLPHADARDLIEEALRHHPQLQRALRTIDTGACRVYAWALGDGDVIGVIRPLWPGVVGMVETLGVRRLPAKLHARPGD